MLSHADDREGYLIVGRISSSASAAHSERAGEAWLSSWKRAAERLLRKLIRKQARAPRVLVTDRLGSYGAARKNMGMKFEHRQHKGLDNRAENSHQPTRRRERIMKGFKSPRQIQRVLVHSQSDCKSLPLPSRKSLRP